jgi:hypothetical protein
MESKPWWKSKTLWINSITAGIAVLTALQGQTIIQDHPQATAAIVAGLSALNIGLRLITYLPLEG